MKFSTKGRYALRMLLDLAEHRDSGFVALKEIASRQDISKQYLEQIVSLLAGTDFLRSNRGKHGGYMLAKEPSQYSVGDILRAADGSLAPIACIEKNAASCQRASHCKTLYMWQGLEKVVADYLDSITLQNILDNANKGGEADYVI
ncbi:MAG: Rrf2 family transcriptional regulator [Oscillospiraceae bacterium]|nr:Rrf2 family transcriptional regulator [Oscillospiraceae bacterium]